MEYLDIVNYKSSIIESISNLLGISEEDGERIFCVLRSEKYPFVGNELQIFREESGNTGLLFLDGLYSLNIKITTLTLLALVLDIKITKGAAMAALQLSGLGKQGFVKLNSMNGERCMAREAVFFQKIDKNIFRNNNKDCVNHDLLCNYRKDGQCTCQPDDVEKLLQELEKMNVFERTATDGVYKPVL